MVGCADTGKEQTQPQNWGDEEEEYRGAYVTEGENCPSDAMRVDEGPNNVPCVREVKRVHSPEMIAWGAHSLEVVSCFVVKTCKIKGVVHRVVKVFFGRAFFRTQGLLNLGLQAQCDRVYHFELQIKKIYHRGAYWTKELFVLCWEA